MLIIEDEPAIADTLVYALKTEGFAPEWCSTGRAGLAAMGVKPFALVVLDVGLPDGSGFDLCISLRTRSTVPVLFLTARNTELDRVLGFELGGDDYLAKPFSPRELTARVKAILRRTNAAGPSPVQSPDEHPPADPRAGSAHAGVVVDAERCVVRFRGIPLHLTRYEFRLLASLAAKPGRVFSRQQPDAMLTGAINSGSARIHADFIIPSSGCGTVGRWNLPFSPRGLRLGATTTSRSNYSLSPVSSCCCTSRCIW